MSLTVMLKIASAALKAKAKAKAWTFEAKAKAKAVKFEPRPMLGLENYITAYLKLCRRKPQT